MFFSDIIQKFKLLPDLGSQMLNTAKSQNIAKKADEQYQSIIKPKESIGSGIFSDVVTKYNLPQVTSQQREATYKEPIKKKVVLPKTERVLSTLKDIAQSLPREGAGAVMEIIERRSGLTPGTLSITPGAGEVLSEEKYGKLGPKVEKILFGNRPVETLTKQGEELLVGFGVDDKSSKKFGLPIGLVMLGLDLTPAGSDDMIKLLAKANKAEDVKNILTTIKTIDNSKITDDIVQSISKTSNKEEIKKLVSGLSNIWNEANKTIPATKQNLQTITKESVKKSSERILKDTEKKATLDFTQQQGIKLTSEVKAKIKGEAPKIETSGKKFEDVKPKPVVQDASPKISKERGFARSVRLSPETAQPIKESLKEIPLTYESLQNRQIIDSAKLRVNNSVDDAKKFIYDSIEPDAEVTATGIELMRHYQKNKDYLSAINIADQLAEKLTKAGQSIQAAKLYANLSPEAVLIKAQKLVREANKNKPFWQKEIQLSEDTAKNLSELAEKMKTATGDLKMELADEIGSILRQIPISGVGRKISMAQTLAQLLNPKTILVRNPLGNELFYRLERMTKYAMTPIDMIRSKLTGTDRVITFKSAKQGEYWKNFMKGLRAGWKGLSPAGLTSQYDIYAPAFKSKWNPLTYLEKTLGATLRSFDYAAYSRAKNSVIGELGYLKALNEGKKGVELKYLAKQYASEVDDAILQIADDYGKYVTYQDNNLISKGFQSLKKGLNVGQEFGVGDLVLKYPRTPGALLMRGLEYSPAGFLRSVYEIANPLLKGKNINSREVLMSLGRAIVGSLGLTGLGYYLADKGIITGKSGSDKDVSYLESAVGGGQYRINLSALKRWVLSGFKETQTQDGDTIYSYDWAQPVALAISLGANMNKNVKESELTGKKKGALSGTAGTLVSSLGGAIETLTEQPLISGVKRFIGGQSPIDSILDTIESMPSSFTPTLLNQFRQVEDPISRQTYDPKMFERAINKVKARIPFIAESLPKKYDTLGNEQTFPQDPNLFNIFLNPGFISEYKPSDAAQLVLNIYNETGETKQFPKVAPKKLTFQGKVVELSGEQYSKFQKDIGEKTGIVFGELARNDKFVNGNNDDKIKILDYVLGKTYAQEKFKILTSEQKELLIKSFSPAEREKFAKDLISVMK